MATLLEAIRRAGRGDRPAPGPPGPAAGFFAHGEIVQADGAGGLRVSVGGQTVTAKAVTDEPFRAGAKVWVSEPSEGWIVHGGVR